jgi:hypothetical protein
LGDDKRQSPADQEALQNVSTHHSRTGKEMPKDEGIDDEKAAYPAGQYRQVSGCLIHIIILSLWFSGIFQCNADKDTLLGSSGYQPPLDFVLSVYKVSPCP